MKRTLFVPSATEMIRISLVALVTVAVPCGAVAQVSFTRILEGDIAQDTGPSVGCAWGDYDSDGYPDFFIADAGPTASRLYHNNGDGTFSRVTEGPLVNDLSDTDTGVWADYDNDGDLDLFMANYSTPQDSFYRNEGNGVFTKVTQGAWVMDTGYGVGAAWGDYDNDGFLDLYVANSGGQNNFLYRNNGDGTMTRITSGPPVTSGGNSHGCAWSDYDGDGYPDLFVIGGNGQSEQQFHNSGDGTFTRIIQGPLVTAGGNDEGISCADYDNDGDPDVLVTGFGLNENRLYRNDGWEGFKPVAASGLKNGNSNNGAWGDYDNDGYLDLFIANYAQDNFLFHNNGDGTFAQVTEGALVHDGGRSCGCAWADYDNDGDLDLFVANGIDFFGTNPPAEPGFLYRNDGGTNHWLMLRLVGVASNRSAIGAKVRILATIGGETFWQLREVSGGDGYCSQNDLRVHFGLGDATTVESVRIEWPSGITQFLRDVAVNQLLTLEEENPTPNNTIPRITPASPDFNGDEIVDGMDIDILFEHWQTDYLLCDIAPPPYGDGVVDVQDLIEVGEHLFEEAYPPELIAYWKLDEAEGEIAYDSVRDNHGVLRSNPAWQPEMGNINGALAFDGADDYIETPFILDPSDGAFSVFAWVRGGAPGQVIVSQSDGADWLLIAADGTLRMNLRAPGRYDALTSKTHVADGAWHAVGLVWDGRYRHLYVDDIEVAVDGNAHGDLSSTSTGLFIGRAGKVDNFFAGLMDDVRIYNRAIKP